MLMPLVDQCLISLTVRVSRGLDEQSFRRRSNIPIQCPGRGFTRFVPSYALDNGARSPRLEQTSGGLRETVRRGELLEALLLLESPPV